MCEHARCMNSGSVAEEVPVGFHYPVFSNMRQLFSVLQERIKPVSQHSNSHVAEISDLLTSYDVPDDEWMQFASFSESKYTRSLIAHDENFTVLLLCWSAGQKSPIHDHAGSSCWVKVLTGNLRERRFRARSDDDPSLEEISDAMTAKNDVVYINDSMGLHEMSNPSKDAVTVTMHVYCPAFYNCFAYSIDGMKRQVSMLAATAPPREIVGIENEIYDDDVSNTSRASTPNTVGLVDFCEMLDRGDCSEEDIVANFSRIFLSQPEWCTYAHFSDFRFQRLLVHQTDNYSVLVLCWLPGQATPPHDHRGSKSWVRVLRGTLTFMETEDGEPIPGRKPVTLTRDSDLFVEDESLQQHVVGNLGKEGEYAVSIHLYNPPYTELHYGQQVASPTKRCAQAFKTPSPPLGSPTERSTNNSFDKSNPEASKSAQQALPVAKKKALSGCVPVVQCQRLGKAQPVKCHLSNFVKLLQRLDDVIYQMKNVVDLEELSVNVMDALDSTNFCPSEIDRYWSEKRRVGHRVRLHENATFNVSLNLWDPNQRSVAHDHDGSLAWVKVIEGELMDINYEAVHAAPEAEGTGTTKVVRTARISSGNACFYGAGSIHALRNRSSERRATSLHVYWSVCNSCRWYSPDSSKPIKVSSQSTKSDYWNVSKTQYESTSMPPSPEARGRSPPKIDPVPPLSN